MATCRDCDCNPCACGRRHFVSDEEYERELIEADQKWQNHPLAPSAVPEDWWPG